MTIDRATWIYWTRKNENVESTTKEYRHGRIWLTLLTPKIICDSQTQVPSITAIDNQNKKISFNQKKNKNKSITIPIHRIKLPPANTNTLQRWSIVAVAHLNYPCNCYSASALTLTNHCFWLIHSYAEGRHASHCEYRQHTTLTNEENVKKQIEVGKSCQLRKLRSSAGQSDREFTFRCAYNVRAR